MKKIALLFVSGLISGLSFAQTLTDAQLPAVVKEKFASMFPGQKVDKWEKEGIDFEAEFTKDKVETSVVFDRKGNLLFTEVEIAVKLLPAAVKEYAKTTLGGKKIAEAAKITDAKGVVTYEAEIDNADYIFDANGNFLKKEVEEGKKDDEDKK